MWLFLSTDKRRGASAGIDGGFDARRSSYRSLELEEVVAASLLKKTMNWAYQHEWRIIRIVGGYDALPRNVLCGLIFGWEVSPETRREIESWITLGQRRLSYQEAVLDHERVKVRAYRS